jgi:hypothetical protein
MLVLTLRPGNKKLTFQIIHMFCKNCGAKLEEGIKFCGKCGTPVDNSAIVQLSPEREISKSGDGEAKVVTGIKKSNTTFEKIIYWASAIAAFFVARYAGIVVFLLFLFAFLIGAWFPGWYLKRKKINQTLINWIIWSNLLTWLLPPLGIITGIATLGFSDIPGVSKKKYMILAIIAIALAMINAIWGAANSLSTQ